MSEKIIPLFGQPTVGEPPARLIKAIEHLLEAAKRGEIEAVAYVAIQPEGNSMFYFYDDGVRDLNVLVGSTTLLAHKALKYVDQQEVVKLTSGDPFREGE